MGFRVWCVRFGVGRVCNALEFCEASGLQALRVFRVLRGCRSTASSGGS